MKIVVDTNIIFSALLNSNSNIVQILLKPNNNLEFYSVKFLQHEIIKPVSYTHLRAHETVLDLVCRLLLEKKKQYKKKKKTQSKNKR